MKKIFLFILVPVILFLAFFVFKSRPIEESEKNQVPQEIPVIRNNPELTVEKPEKVETEKKDFEIPLSAKNSAPFTSQAPHAKWDDLHDEACEEASIIMAYYYLENKEKISIKEAESEIQAMVDFQMSYFGSHKDLTAEEMVDLTEQFYEKKLSVKNFESKQEALTYMKENLAQENIFIIPAAGRKLENPYFKTPGPLYHALVIKGFDETTKEFITNDPGTRRGESFRYSYDVIWDSIHDFPGKKDDILEGNKTVILVEK